MSEKKFNYVYLTTNLIDNKKYIGDHSTNNIFDSYIGSGKYLKSAIKKYGRRNFRRDILEKFPTKKEAFEAQQKYISEYNTLVPNGYNISPAGGFQNSNGWSLDSRKKISKAHTGKIISAEIRKKMSESKIGIPHNGIIWNKDKKWGEETKIKMSKSAKKRLSNKENHPLFGKKFSQESKNKMSASHTGVSLSDEHKNKIKLKISGKNNPMYGITLLDKWINKFGVEEANKKYLLYKEKLSKNSRWKNNKL